MNTPKEDMCETCGHSQLDHKSVIRGSQSIWCGGACEHSRCRCKAYINAYVLEPDEMEELSLA